MNIEEPNKRPGADGGWRVLFALVSPCPHAAQAAAFGIMTHSDTL